MTKAQTLAKFSKVAEAHGFMFMRSQLNEPATFTGGQPKDNYHWTRPDSDARQHRITLWIWADGETSCFYRYHQTNKIYAPCQCSNANQLHKALTQDNL